MRWVDEGKFGANELESVRSQTRLSSSSFVVNQQQTVRWVGTSLDGYGFVSYGGGVSWNVDA